MKRFCRVCERLVSVKLFQTDLRSVDKLSHICDSCQTISLQQKLGIAIESMKCCKCKEEKAICCFHRDAGNKRKYGLDIECKVCRSNYRTKNLERSIQKSRNKYLTTEQETLKRWRDKENKSPVGKYHKYKSASKNRGHSFDLSYEQFMLLWQKPCSYCGSNIETIGIDRVDNTKGYDILNCMPCCLTCNKGKSTLTSEEWHEYLKRLVAFQSLKP